MSERERDASLTRKEKIIYDADLGQFVIAVRINLTKIESYSNRAEIYFHLF